MSSIRTAQTASTLRNQVEGMTEFLVNNSNGSRNAITQRLANVADVNAYLQQQQSAARPASPAMMSVLVKANSEKVALEQEQEHDNTSVNASA